MRNIPITGASGICMFKFPYFNNHLKMFCSKNLFELGWWTNLYGTLSNTEGKRLSLSFIDEGQIKSFYFRKKPAERVLIVTELSFMEPGSYSNNYVHWAMVVFSCFFLLPLLFLSSRFKLIFLLFIFGFLLCIILLS